MPVVSHHTINGRMVAVTMTAQVSLLPDALGSVAATAYDAAAPDLQLRATPYGSALMGNAGWLRYSWVCLYGYRRTDLKHAEMYVRARHYSTTDGAWTSADPLWPDESAYGYAEGNPGVWIDPSGLQVPDPVPPSLPPGWSIAPGGGANLPPGWQIISGGAGSSCAARAAIIIGGQICVIVGGAYACYDLKTYCQTGKPGLFTGIGDKLGKWICDRAFPTELPAPPLIPPKPRKKPKPGPEPLPQEPHDKCMDWCSKRLTTLLRSNPTMGVGDGNKFKKCCSDYCDLVVNAERFGHSMPTYACEDEKKKIKSPIWKWF